MKKSFATLPEGYKPCMSVDLKKDKKLAFLVNGIALLIAVVMVVPMLFKVLISDTFNFGVIDMFQFTRLLSLALGSFAYIILHEAVHGVAMKICGTKKIKYGFTGVYAFAGSDDYYSKGAYIFIALAPVVLWGAVLLVLNFIVPTSWFWVVYLIQVSNISGAAGDAYVTFRFSRLPKDILVHDSGVAMTVYSKE